LPWKLLPTSVLHEKCHLSKKTVFIIEIDCVHCEVWAEAEEGVEHQVNKTWHKQIAALGQTKLTE
jgi:hypothetical protein